jgi:hypothetical protein
MQPDHRDNKRNKYDPEEDKPVKTVERFAPQKQVIKEVTGRKAKRGLQGKQEEVVHGFLFWAKARLIVILSGSGLKAGVI